MPFSIDINLGGMIDDIGNLWDDLDLDGLFEIDDLISLGDSLFFGGFFDRLGDVGLFSEFNLDNFTTAFDVDDLIDLDFTDLFNDVGDLIDLENIELDDVLDDLGDLEIFGFGLGDVFEGVTDFKIFDDLSLGDLFETISGLDLDESENYDLLDGAGFILDLLDTNDILNISIDDLLRGGLTNERLRGQHHNDLLVGLDGNDVLVGLAGHDIINGGDGSDRLRGLNGHDIVLGQVGNDLVSGGRGNDVLYGGADRDRLIGGKGGDTFVIEVGGQQDVLKDFGRGNDQIALNGISADDVSFVAQRQHTVLQVDGEAIAIVKNVGINDISASDLIELVG